METISYFWSYLEIRCIVLYTIAKRLFFLYNATLFVTITSCTKWRAEIIPFIMWWGRQEGNVQNLGSTEQFTRVLVSLIVWDAVLIWLNGDDPFKVDGLKNIPNFLWVVWDFIMAEILCTKKYDVENAT